MPPGIYTRKPTDKIKLFWRHVNKTETCWIWNGSKNNRGYGQFNLRKSSGEKTIVLAHRFSYEIENGPIPFKLCILHKCDNPPCVRPDHLFLGSQVDNAIDMINKGRGNKVNGIRNANSKLTTEKVIKLRSLYDQGVKVSVLCKMFGVSHNTASKVAQRRWWNSV